MKSVELLRYLEHPRKRIHAKLVSSSTEDETECVRFEVEVDLPQRPVKDIRATERILVRFPPNDGRPQVFALRKDFPRVSHLILGEKELPRQLCIYERQWSDERSNWSPRSFVERIRSWLRGTADGTIHPDDQALEPVMQTSALTLVLPPIKAPAGQTSWVEQVYLAKIADDYFIAHRTPPLADKSRLVIPVFFIRTPVVEHSILYRSPRDLGELENILKGSGISVVKILASQVALIRAEFKALKNQGVPLLLVLELPKCRHAGGEVESIEYQGFVATTDDIFREEMKEVLHDGIIVPEPHLAIEDPAKLETVHIAGVTLRWHLSQKTAAEMNGHTFLPTKVVTIGAGALGSQVANHMWRGGFGVWTIIDDDRLEPHNLARHLLDSRSTGRNKALALATRLGAVFPEQPAPVAIAANYLQPHDQTSTLSAALNSAELILDFSASVPVQRKLAFDSTGGARRASAFLNQRGDESVILVEDTSRHANLAWLEAVYMQAVASDLRLTGHFDDADRAAHRYGNGCRDLSATVPQDGMALHSGLISAELRKAVEQPAAIVTVRRWNRVSGDVVAVPIPVRMPISCEMAGWQILLHPDVLSDLVAQRVTHLPDETGGILLGTFDRTHRYIAITGFRPAPSDSEAWPTSFLRGSNGLAAQVEKVSKRTLGNVGYVGEWHSHPKGHNASPSVLDLEAVAICSVDMGADALPTLMLIVGEAELGVVLKPAEITKIFLHKIPFGTSPQ